MAPDIPSQERTDSFEDKVRLLQAALAAKQYDLALSLADSIKDTLTFERHLGGNPERPQVGADHFAPVGELPEAWARWALGWSFCKSLALFETVAIERSAEPVDLAVAFRADQTTDLGREVRVARIDPGRATLHEVHCQVYGEVRRGKERHCRLVFFADVPAHGQGSYVIFYGNPIAERPQYQTDLRVTGEGYGLDVENRHFLARLSRQMGQLERLTLKREHGLELYAGGKGHGEPPTIDWAHDYVDPGHFQKLRMRNWAASPNWEVVRGPLCVRVRRWGFPHSPVHPLFTPSRIHMDVTYVFYAGVPYFFKQSSFDVVKDCAVEAMRDDEWVFSGYSFTDTVWIDRQGKLHEGQAPDEGLWGVGFFHRHSRDAFIALWLEHSASGAEGIQHGGPPTLHYDGHGQLWSRYPVNRTQLKAGASIRQRNAYLSGPYLQEGAAARIERLRHQLVNPLEVRPEKPPRVAAAPSVGALARPGETADTAPLKPAVWQALGEVRDEQLYKVDANVVDMGYVYDVRIRDGVVEVLVTMPHRGRPVYDFLVTRGGGRVGEGIRERLLRVKGVRDVAVHFTWDPPWTVSRLTDAGCRALGLSL
ncbi:MAG: metal-sulfur cluster assembly factor [Gemmataceae bacterium]|nr:metal-sulfur cluster assembly factor [Gemmataceae bacterium]